MRKRFSVVAMVVIATMLMVPAVLAATTVETVTEDNVGDDWYVYEQRLDGSYAFVEGPGTPPEGVGSLEIVTPGGSDKLTFVTGNYLGTPLSQLTGLEYATYRASTSTSGGHVVPSVNIFIINAGPAGDQGTMASPVPLVWEAVYGYGAGAIDDDTWQTWDTTSTSSGSGWWSTRGLGTICSFNCFVDWTTVLEQNPSATIVAMGVNVGSGPGGSFVGATDAFAPTFGDETIIYDFDVVVEPESKDDCKKGGWEVFDFKNQGQCIQFVNTGRDSR